MPMLAKSQERGKDFYAEAVQELRNMDEEVYFYTPRYRVTISGNSTFTI
jgi:hypothetical protein